MPLVARRMPPSLPPPSKREHRVLVGGDARDRRARAGRADLLVAVDEDRQRRVVLEAELVEHRDDVQDQRDALLVVGDAEPVGAVAVDPKRLVLEHAAQVDGVHVRDQQHLLLAGALPFGLHHRAGLGRRVVHLEDIGRRQHGDLAAELAQAIGDQAGDLLEAFDVLAARLDRDQLAQRVEQRLLLLARRLVDRRNGRRWCERGDEEGRCGGGEREGAMSGAEGIRWHDGRRVHEWEVGQLACPIARRTARATARRCRAARILSPPLRSPSGNARADAARWRARSTRRIGASGRASAAPRRT
jgi:hypothetical protein